MAKNPSFHFRFCLFLSLVLSWNPVSGAEFQPAYNWRSKVLWLPPLVVGGVLGVLILVLFNSPDHSSSSPRNFISLENLRKGLACLGALDLVIGLGLGFGFFSVQTSQLN